MKLISIITPTHNRGKNYLSQLIQSVAKQAEVGFKHEHIIVDNKSTDNTRKLVRALAKKDPRIKYIYNPRNLGAADALNVGFQKSKGEFIVPADDDDLLPPQSLQSRFDFFQQNPKAKWAYGHLLYIDDTNRLIDGPREMDMRRSSIKNLVHGLLYKYFIPGGTVTVRRECIKKIGGWNPDLMTQDYDLSLRLAEAGYIPHEIGNYLYFYRKHPQQSHKLQIQKGVYAKERAYYLDKYKITEEQLKNLAK